MNWKAVRRHNAIRTQQKNRREAIEAAHERRIEKLGGPVTLAELKGAVRHMAPPAPGGYGGEREVWQFRGRDWWVMRVDDYVTAYPFVPYRQYPDAREYVPLTPAARKYALALFAAEDAEREAGFDEPCDPATAREVCPSCGEGLDADPDHCCD